jgi:cytochrome c-type biogenesis protein CcmH/NrfG
MNYWKGLLVAAVFDVGCITGIHFLATEPHAWPPPAVESAEPALLPLGELNALSETVDSLMRHLQQHPQDVAAVTALAHLYVGHGWHDDAIGPLARAVELASGDEGLREELDAAARQSGRTLTDALVAQAAREFLETVAMWGHGC